MLSSQDSRWTHNVKSGIFFITLAPINLSTRVDLVAMKPMELLALCTYFLHYRSNVFFALCRRCAVALR